MAFSCWVRYSQAAISIGYRIFHLYVPRGCLIFNDSIGEFALHWPEKRCIGLLMTLTGFKIAILRLKQHHERITGQNSTSNGG